MVNILRQFLEHQEGSWKKSTALQPIIYIVLLLLTALVGLFKIGAPLWASILLSSILICVLLFFMGSYVYFMLKNSDALRSEKFNITKFALERGLVGDDAIGAVLSFEEKQTLPIEEDDERSP